jgi:hypothetical protein
MLWQMILVCSWYGQGANLGAPGCKVRLYFVIGYWLLAGSSCISFRLRQIFYIVCALAEVKALT